MHERNRVGGNGTPESHADKRGAPRGYMITEFLGGIRKAVRTRAAHRSAETAYSLTDRLREPAPVKSIPKLRPAPSGLCGTHRKAVRTSGVPGVRASTVRSAEVVNASPFPRPCRVSASLPCAFRPALPALLLRRAASFEARSAGYGARPAQSSVSCGSLSLRRCRAAVFFV